MRQSNLQGESAFTSAEGTYKRVSDPERQKSHAPGKLRPISLCRSNGYHGNVRSGKEPQGADEKDGRGWDASSSSRRPCSALHQQVLLLFLI